MRLHQIEREYDGRVRVQTRPFPLELFGRPAAPRALLSEEWWLAAVQEPRAAFATFQGDDWPTTTMPAFLAVRALEASDWSASRTLDMRIRRAFFAESRNIGRPDVILELVRDIGADPAPVASALTDAGARRAIEETFHDARQRLGVRGTPTLMLEDGTRLTMPMATPRVIGGRIASVGQLTCSGAGCDAAVRGLFERALGPVPAAAQPNST